MGLLYLVSVKCKVDMKTYISDIIPKIQRFSEKLENLTLLTNQHWVVIDEIENSKNVYIFRGNNELLISSNGNVERGKWEYLGNNSLLIDRKENSYLFKQGFFDQNILVLKIDGKEEYAFLVNETRFDKELNSMDNIIEFLHKNYNDKSINPKFDTRSSSILKYTSPKYKIHKSREEYSIFSGTTEIYDIEFEDGESGTIYCHKNAKEVYFEDNIKLKFSILKHYYINIDSCCVALHYFLKTQKKLDEGFIITKY